MKGRARLALLSLLLAVTVIYDVVAYWGDDIRDAFDSRPALTILFIGNSRTYENNMPRMLREIADSAGNRQRYAITMHAIGGVSFEDHWNNAEVHALLGHKWDYVVFQGRSNEQITANANASFLEYGGKLIELAKLNHSVPVLFVTWRYADADNTYFYFPAFKHEMHDLIQANYLKLANATGAQVVNVGKAWADIERQSPGFSLYKDTNHPSVYGSYLSALMIYEHFSGDDLARVTFVPKGISPKDADFLKLIAQKERFY